MLYSPLLIPRRQRFVLLLTALLALGGPCAVLAATVGGSTPQSVVVEREAAVAAARSGELTDALRRLDDLFEAHPDDRGVRLDLAVVAAWAGQDQRTAALLDPLDPAALPDYVLEAYAKTVRNLKRWERSLSLYARLEARRPEAVEPALAQVLVLADADRIAEARQALESLRRRVGEGDDKRADVHFACGYVEERDRQFTRALHCYNQALALQPAHPDARRRRIVTASALGAPRQALKDAEAHPGVLSPAELQRLRQDSAAVQVRWAYLPSVADPRGHARAALEIQQDLLEPNPVGAISRSRSSRDIENRDPEIARTCCSASGARSVLFDRVAALAASGRMTEAVRLFEQIEGAADDRGSSADAAQAFPPYVLSAAARAYLDLERPERAATLYRAALRQRPDSFELQQGLFYAYSDLQDHPRARLVAERIEKAQPAWSDTRPGRWTPNRRYADAQQLAAMDLAFRDRYQDALQRLEGLLALAPANDALRLSRAQVLRWRGWNDAAELDVQRVQLAEPANLQANLLAGQLAMDGRRFEQAEDVLLETMREAPDAGGAAPLARRWRLHLRPQLLLDAGAGRSDGGAFASRDWHMDTYYFSAPLDYRHRVFVHDRISYGRFDEGAGRDHRLGAGVERLLPRWRMRVELNRGLADHRDTGAVGDVAWFVSDRLTLEAQIARHAADVPLRAIRSGVSGAGASATARYRWHEAREASLSGGGLNMDDDNQRRWMQLDFSQRLMNLPRHKLAATARIYASRNSNVDAAYYNPASDREAVAGLVHEWRVFSRYDHGLTQRLGMEAGDYHQQDFGSGSVWGMFLEHDWRLGARARLRYGLRHGGRVYDGEREHTASAYLSMEWRP